MERPPLPFWITAVVVQVIGDNPVAYRLAPLFMGWWCVLLVGWMASVWYGRGVGLASGLILATMHEFTHYSTGAEADIFLCAIVTAALALFVYLEFCRRPAEAESVAIIGLRPWPVLLFFVVLGATNLAKGLFFGAIFVCLPIAVFLLWNADVRRLRRYIWLPGWLACVAVGASWAVAAYLRYPGALDFWHNDYGGRVNQGYMREPFWYYFAQWPLVVFPWPILIIFGFAHSAATALRTKYAPERFLWCWGLAPILFFSIPQGKHHHYLLQTAAPWAVLGALGAVRFWNLVSGWRQWARPAWAGILAGLPVSVAVILLRTRIPGPAWAVPALAVLTPIVVAFLWWTAMQQKYLRGLTAACFMVMSIHWAAYAYRTAYLDRYREDSQFIHETAKLVPAENPVLVMDDDAPLNASWLLYYLDGRARLLHNLTFLRADNIHDAEVYLVARKKQEPALLSYGTFEAVLQSEHSRYEVNPLDRYALYRLRFHDDLERVPGPVPISPLQATGRAAGPYLD